LEKPAPSLQEQTENLNKLKTLTPTIYSFTTVTELRRSLVTGNKVFLKAY